MKVLAKSLNEEADNLFPFETTLNEETDVIRFDYKKMLWHILSIHGLGEAIFEREVEIAIIIDGANLSKRLLHVTAVIKV